MSNHRFLQVMALVIVALLMFGACVPLEAPPAQEAAADEAPPERGAAGDEEEGEGVTEELPALDEEEAAEDAEGALEATPAPEEEGAVEDLPALDEEEAAAEEPPERGEAGDEDSGEIHVELTDIEQEDEGSADSDSDQGATDSTQSASGTPVCDPYTIGTFYAVKWVDKWEDNDDGEWWRLEHDECKDDWPRFKLEGIRYQYPEDASHIKTLATAEAEGLSVKSSQQKDLTCEGEELADTAPQATGLSEADKQKIVDAHNRERDLANVSDPVAWDVDLAEFSMGWDKAVQVHNAKGIVAPVQKWPHSLGSCYFKKYASQYAPGWTYENIGTVQGFISEKDDYENGACKPDKECGHYIAMIDPDVTKIGCSRDGGWCQYAK